MYSLTTDCHPGELNMEYQRHETTRSGLVVVRTLGRTTLELGEPEPGQARRMASAIEHWLDAPFPNQQRPAGPPGYNGETMYRNLPAMTQRGIALWNQVRPEVPATRAYSTYEAVFDEGYPTTPSGLVVVEGMPTRIFRDYVASTDELNTIDRITQTLADTLPQEEVPGNYI